MECITYQDSQIHLHNLQINIWNRTATFEIHNPPSGNVQLFLDFLKGKKLTQQTNNLHIRFIIRNARASFDSMNAFTKIIASGEIDTQISETGEETTIFFVLPKFEIGHTHATTHKIESTQSTIICCSGARDKTILNIEGSTWILRDCYRDYLSLNIYYERGGIELPQKFDAMLLETSVVATNEQILQTIQIAHKLCALLSIAIGKSLFWQHAYIITDGELQIFKTIDTISPPSHSVIPIIPTTPKYLDCIKTFIETAYPIFSRDEAWWIPTAYKFSAATQEQDIIEALTKYCILLDRIPKKILESTLTKKNTIPYREKIINILETRGYKFTDLEKKDLQQRNNLIHEGCVDIEMPEETPRLYVNFSNYVRLLILSMLHYPEYFSSPQQDGSHIKRLRDILPQYTI